MNHRLPAAFEGPAEDMQTGTLPSVLCITSHRSSQAGNFNKIPGFRARGLGDSSQYFLKMCK